MVELSRRFFLGGAISLLAASTIVPTISMGSNLPRIFANGRDDDSEGFQALFDGKECIFKAENIAVLDCKGVAIHKGNFVISNQIWVDYDRPLTLESGNFNGEMLRPDDAFFSLPGHAESGDGKLFAINIGGEWKRAKGAKHWGRYDGDGNQLMLKVRSSGWGNQNIYAINRQMVAHWPAEQRREIL